MLFRTTASKCSGELIIWKNLLCRESSTSESLVSSSSKSVRGPWCDWLDWIGMKSSDGLASLSWSATKEVVGSGKLCWTTDGPSYGSILISIASVFVLLAGFWSENAVENLVRPLDWIGSISSLELVTCAVGGKKLGWNDNSNNKVQLFSSSDKEAWTSLFTLGVQFLATGKLIFDFVNYIVPNVS